MRPGLGRRAAGPGCRAGCHAPASRVRASWAGTVPCQHTTPGRAQLGAERSGRRCQGGTVSITGQGTATQVQLQVCDTGSGIAAERLERIFEPLYTTKPGGTGLGLYIVREIVAAHRGQITVTSVEGQGTDFYSNAAAGFRRGVSTGGAFLAKRLSSRTRWATPLASLLAQEHGLSTVLLE